MKLANDPRLSENDRKIVHIPSKLPACPKTHLTIDMCPKTGEEAQMSEKPYKGLLGQALFIAITTRPDIATAVSACGKFAMNPGPKHWSALLQIASYLIATKDFVLTLGGHFNHVTISAFSDADWAGDLDNRRSRSGYLVCLNSSSVIWSSKLQASVALSSTEAEYIALSQAARDVIWTRNFIEELGFKQKNPTVIFEDNRSCVKIAESTKQLPGTKHIAIRHHFIRERISSHEIKLERKATIAMVADIFTKALVLHLFLAHRMALGVGVAIQGEC